MFLAVFIDHFLGWGISDYIARSPIIQVFMLGTLWGCSGELEISPLMLER